MKRQLYILTLSLCAAMLLPKSSNAQQIPLFTQYMMNRYVLNPAIAGTTKQYIAKMNNRYQWVGVTDAPRTFTLSLHGPHSSLPMGWGGYVINDVTGPTSRSGVYGSYSYNIQLYEGTRLSFGLSAGVLQFAIDETQITLSNINDPAMLNLEDQTEPDATFGTYLYHENYYGGVVVNQLFANQLDLVQSESGETAINKLKNHYYVHGGYIFNATKDLDIDASTMVKIMTPVPAQLEFGLKATWRKMIWGGATYRHGDAVTILLGYSYFDQVMFGYSYDITLSNLSNYSSGTHELLLGIKFEAIRGGPAMVD